MKVVCKEVEMKVACQEVGMKVVGQTEVLKVVSQVGAMKVAPEVEMEVEGGKEGWQVVKVASLLVVGGLKAVRAKEGLV